MVRGRSAAGTLASTCGIVERLPLEVWTAVEDALIDIGWTAVHLKHFIAHCDCVNCICTPPCDFVRHGIGARTFASATPVCRNLLTHCWYNHELGNSSEYSTVRVVDGNVAKALRKSASSSHTMVSHSSMTSAVDGGSNLHGSACSQA